MIQSLVCLPTRPVPLRGPEEGPVKNPLSNFVLYQQPAAQPRSSVYKLWVNGEQGDVLKAEKADFAAFECDGPVELLITSSFPLSEASVRPTALGIAAEAQAHSLRFLVESPCYRCVDVPGHKPLFIYANSPELEKPSAEDPSVLYYAAGQIHPAGQVELKSGETLYIEAGAVLLGNVFCSEGHNVKIRGRGILDGSCYDLSQGETVRSIIFEGCEDVLVEDIIMIEPSSWMLVLARSRGVHIHDLKQIGSCVSSDGIDICGTSQVLIENCCLRNDDDNIAIKSVSPAPSQNWEGNVEDVLVRRCIFLNGNPGNVMEIGYELRASHVRNIVFQDIDVLNAHGEGAVFSIHNGDRATVENILWDNIRVEHYWDKLIDFRVVRARYNKDKERGTIRDIHLKNIRVMHSIFNPGCSISVISGYTPSTPVENVVIEDFYLNDEKVTCSDQLDLHLRNAVGIHFR